MGKQRAAQVQTDEQDPSNVDPEGVAPGEEVEEEEEEVDRGDHVAGDEVDKEVDKDTGDDEKDDEKDGEKDDDKDGEKSTDKDGFIPRYRYNQVAKRNKELEARVSELEATAAKPPPATSQQQAPAPAEGESGVAEQLKAIAKDIAAALKDGDSDKVETLMQQQYDLQEQRYLELAQQTASTESSKTREEMEYDRVVERMEQDLPFLNRDNEDMFNEELEHNIVLFRNAFISQGMPMAEALLKAQEQAAPLIEMARTEYQAAIDASNPSDAPPVDDPETKRKEEARKRNAKDASRVPPSTNGVGKDSDKAGPKSKLDPIVMTEDEFDKLPDEELARLRGDFE